MGIRSMAIEARRIGLRIADFSVCSVVLSDWFWCREVEVVSVLVEGGLRWQSQGIDLHR